MRRLHEPSNLSLRETSINGFLIWRQMLKLESGPAQRVKGKLQMPSNISVQATPDFASLFIVAQVSASPDRVRWVLT